MVRRNSSWEKTGWRKIGISLFGILATALWLAGAGSPAWAKDIVVFAAASTSDALIEIAEDFRSDTGISVTTVFSASSTAAKQITQGAPADIFLSANVQWMDYLAKMGFLQDGRRWDLLSNSLVLISPQGADQNITARDPRKTLLQAEEQLKEGAPENRMVIGDPEHVPAGIYAKTVLEAYDMWDGLRPHIAYAGDVRRALALVERQEALYGLVYRSDAQISNKVKVVAEFPVNSKLPIVYPVAVIAGKERPAVLRFFEYLADSQSRDTFEKFGFRFLDQES